MLVSIGVCLGVPAVFAVSRISRSLLYGVGDFDPIAFGIVILLLLACAAVAGGLPALRAGRLNPVAALRGE